MSRMSWAGQRRSSSSPFSERTAGPIRKYPIHSEEVNTVSTILTSIEEILDGAEVEIGGMPVNDLPDNQPNTEGGC
jgi:hypothetical protein